MATIPTPLLQGVLDKASIAQLLAGTPPLIEGLIDPQVQLQPNGIDLTLRTLAALTTAGQLGMSMEDRVLSKAEEITFDTQGYVHLPAGFYLATLNEVVHLPPNLAALAWPRSSLLRCGVTIHNAVWDAGYEGRSQCLMSVFNPLGLRIARNARILQMLFFPLAQPVTEGYQGVYQRENL